jgi:single-strand DNA-binding protein
MATDLNQVMVVGRLVRDAEIKTLPNGTEVAELSIANNWSWKKGDQWVDEVSYFDVTKFNPRGLGRYLTKGTQIAVNGEIQQQRWEKDGKSHSRVKIMARQIQLLGSKPGSASQDSSSQDQLGFEDDVPF